MMTLLRLEGHGPWLTGSLTSCSQNGFGLVTLFLYYMIIYKLLLPHLHFVERPESMKMQIVNMQ